MRGNPYKETNLKDLEINSLKEENQKLRSQLEVKPSKFKLWFLKSWSLILMGMLSAVAVFILFLVSRKLTGSSCEMNANNLANSNLYYTY
jgi:hypothetical protein